MNYLKMCCLTQGKTNPTPDIENFKKGTHHIHWSCMGRTEIMKEVKDYTVSHLLNLTQDYNLWFKIYLAGYKGYNLKESLYKMRDDREATRNMKN